MQKKEENTPTVAATARTASKARQTGHGSDERTRLTLTYLEHEGIRYHVPEGKKWCVNYFDSFYMTAGGMFIHTGRPERTLYAAEPMFSGHDASRFSLKCCFPADDYRLSRTFLQQPDCMLALYRDGLPEPLWLGRPTLSGSLTAVLPYERYEYGKYFLYITNLKPGTPCAKQFVRMGTGWRYDFEFMPNGITLQQPQVTIAGIRQGAHLHVSFADYTPTPYDRFTVLFYDQALNYMGPASDIRPDQEGVDLPLPAGRIWTDGTYHAIVQHNLYSYRLITFTSENGYMEVERIERITEDSMFFRLSVDVNGNDAILNQWQRLYGCGPVKEQLLQFTATHDMDDYQDFIFTACDGYVPHPKVMAALLYGPEAYVDYNVGKKLEERLAAPTELSNPTLPAKGLAIVGIHNLNVVTKGEAELVIKDLETLCSRPNTYLLVCGTPQEMNRLDTVSKVMHKRLAAANRWDSQEPILQDYMRMCEKVLAAMKRPLSRTPLKTLAKRITEAMEKQKFIRKEELANLVAGL